MKRTAWRIVKAAHAKIAFNGEGARLYGGRWNSAGIAVVYASATRALAALESLVHLNPPVRFKYVAIAVEFDDSLLESMRAAKLPANWKEQPAPPSAKAVGDLWVKEARSAVLELPSVIVPAESNYLLNPAHPDFKSIRVGKPEPFSFDSRLLG